MTAESPAGRREEPSPGGRDIGQLYETWCLPVRRFVYRLTGDAAQAEDVTHEAFLRLLGTKEVVREPGSWLFRTALNMVRDAARRHATHDRAAADWPSDPPERPDERLDRSETVRAVRVALDRLAPRDREVLLMRESGFSYEEIATACDVQLQSVPTIIMRALRRFRASYETGAME